MSFYLHITRRRRTGPDSEYGRAWENHIVYSQIVNHMARVPVKGDWIAYEDDEFEVTRVIFDIENKFVKVECVS